MRKKFSSAILSTIAKQIDNVAFQGYKDEGSNSSQLLSKKAEEQATRFKHIIKKV
jgi:hypothetical protein